MNNIKALFDLVNTRTLVPADGVRISGNGRVGATIRDTDLLQAFGPMYGTPPMVSMCLCRDEDIMVRQARLAGSDVWHTELLSPAGERIGEILDLVHTHLPVFFRAFRLARPLNYRVTTGGLNLGRVFDAASAPSLTFRIPEGTPVFMTCRTDCELFCRLLLPEGTVIAPDPSDAQATLVTLPAGDGVVTFLAGEPGARRVDSLPSCLALTDDVRAMDLLAVWEERLADWQACMARVRDMGPLVKNLPEDRRNEILEAVDSVAVALRAEQSIQGGELAGPFYHLGYGRDMYGVIRGFLALGLYPEAARAIDFFVNTYRQKGWVPNASGMGTSCSHFHENDLVEQTGYMLLELSDYVRATGDDTFIRERIDYVTYLLSAQESQLAGGMLPFNGDETYIAGGILPRDCIDHGSMEATALYLAGASRVLEICAAQGYLPRRETDEHLAILADVRARFDNNFTEARDGRSVVLCNQPRRLDLCELPPMRHGVCLGCGRFDWLRRTPEGGCLCPECWGTRHSAAGRQAHVLDCALLMTGYVSADLPAPELTRAAALAGYARRTEGTQNTAVNAVGYEYGLWLYVLADPAARTSPELLDDILAAVLAQRVSAGVWAEYYFGDKVNPHSCPYRPWESAINLTGILRYLENR